MPSGRTPGEETELYRQVCTGQNSRVGPQAGGERLPVYITCALPQAPAAQLVSWTINYRPLHATHASILPVRSTCSRWTSTRWIMIVGGVAPCRRQLDSSSLMTIYACNARPYTIDHRGYPCPFKWSPSTHACDVDDPLTRGIDGTPSRRHLHTGKHVNGMRGAVLIHPTAGPHILKVQGECV